VKYFLIFVLALGFATPTFAETAPAKKSSKKALKKVPPSEPVATPEATPEATPTPTPTVAPEATIAAPPATTETTTVTETKSEEPTDSSKGLLGDFRIGPSVTLLGFPTPFRFGIEAKYNNLIGLSIDYGFFPSLTLSTVKVKYNSWRVGAQVYPFQGAFYIGFGFGKQNFTGAFTKDTAGTSVDYNLAINTTILTPHLGWRWVGASGFFFGMEVGAQLASSSSATFTSSVDRSTLSPTAQAEYDTNKADVEDKGKTFGQTTLPAFALVQMGWLF